ncbi:tetratricopeptide repeat protein [Kribbella sp. NBC_01245]|uniref:AfsR/SARP family transcriptional regulator n=1 Tax=Kribbella sp. NBC_01245 TaxID=2903578 RepID=UPI002E28A2F6|nr:BTAD domain-containing putative transcriptional regulator [Kribbella sp. NBC_01245]
MESASNRPRADVRLLGPVEVIGPGGLAVLPGSRQRALLGLLALQPGVVVARTTLIDALWGEDPPRTALKTLYSHVTRVRQALEACGLPDLFCTREPGYVLAISPAEVDVSRFEKQVASARAAARPAEASKLLHEAMTLWRGDAFADAPLAGAAMAAIDRLQEIRISAAEDLWAAELELGEHGRSASELEVLVARHPYRERLVGLLMTARYRSGRHADALEAYHRLRTRLADELGVDPGPELRRQYAAILRHEAPMSPVAAKRPHFPKPAQLPAPVGHFTGRTRELAVLDDAVSQAKGRPRVLALSGPGGMGKTALALQWAHAVEHDFPDGQLFLDLRGHEPGQAMAATEALPRLLRSLGVSTDRVPAELSEQSGLYRSFMHNKRILVLLDNCGAVDQLLPLVPGGESSLLLVTSRSRLTALGAHHAVRLVDLDALDNDEALDLLGQMLGAERIEREPDAAAKLADLCGRMPLAVRIAAAILAAHPLRPITELCAALEGENRLDALSIDGDSRSVRTVFASAYDALTPAAARLFRLLGLHAGPTVQVHLASAAADVSLPQARALLAELVTAQLIADLGHDRYRFHDLIRLYASECAQQDEPPEQRAETISRIVDWYLAIAQIANRALDPSRNRVVPTLQYPPTETGIADATDRDAVLAFLDGERPNLVPVTRAATELGHHRAAWQLTYLLTGWFEFRGHRTDRIEICRWAVDAAQRDGDEFAEGLMWSSLGVAYKAAHRFAEALEPLNRSIALTSSTGDKRGLGNALNNLANAYVGLRRYDEAIDAFHQALPLYGETGQQAAMAATLSNLGETYVQIGQVELGFDYLTRALAQARELADLWLEGAITHNLGQAYLEHGSAETAVAHLREALAIRQRAGDQHFAPDTLAHLGAAYLACGDTAAAADVLQQALTASRGIADEQLEARILTLLEELPRGGNRSPAAAPTPT